jgi:hypothetical protein
MILVSIDGGSKQKHQKSSFSHLEHQRFLTSLLYLANRLAVHRWSAKLRYYAPYDAYFR